MEVKIFFVYENRIVQLPVNPESLTFSSDTGNESYNIVGLGEMTLFNTPKSIEFEIESFFPATTNGGNYILTSNEFEEPDFYIAFFNKIRREKKSVLFVLTGYNKTFHVTIEDFVYSFNAGSDDVNYTLTFKQWSDYKCETEPIDEKKKSSSKRTKVPRKKKVSRPKKGFSVGDEVIVNGKYWYTSYGASPFGIFKNFHGKISHIVADKSRKYRYHITTLNGGWRGWVKADQLKHI